MDGFMQSNQCIELKTLFPTASYPIHIPYREESLN
jgi:hypothetical protein